MVKLCGSSLMLTLPHHTSSRTSGSSTTRLSVGERPVFFPDIAMSAPVDEIADPFSNRSAASYKNDGVALRCTSGTVMPWGSSENFDMRVTRLIQQRRGAGSGKQTPER